MSTKMSISAADAQDMVHMHRTRSMGPKALAGHYLQYSESAIQRTLAFAKRNGFVKQLRPSSPQWRLQQREDRGPPLAAGVREAAHSSAVGRGLLGSSADPAGERGALLPAAPQELLGRAPRRSVHEVYSPADHSTRSDRLMATSS